MRTTEDFLLHKYIPGRENNRKHPATQKNPTTDCKPFNIIDCNVDLGKADEGMPEILRGTPIWQVRL